MPATWLSGSHAAASTRAGLRLRSSLAASRLAAFPQLGRYPPWASCVFGTARDSSSQRHTGHKGGTHGRIRNTHEGRRTGHVGTAGWRSDRPAPRRADDRGPRGHQAALPSRCPERRRRQCHRHGQAVSRSLRLRILLRSAGGGLRRGCWLVLQAMRAAPHAGRKGRCECPCGPGSPEARSLAGERVRPEDSGCPTNGPPPAIWRPSNEHTSRRTRRTGNDGTVRGAERNAGSPTCCRTGSASSGAGSGRRRRSVTAASRTGWRFRQRPDGNGIEVKCHTGGCSSRRGDNRAGGR